VGVKWNWNRGWRRSQVWMAGVLWVLELSSTTWTSRLLGTTASMASSESPRVSWRLQLLRRME
jgi:hypothetical protein